MITRIAIGGMFRNGNPAWLDCLAELGPVLARHYHWSDREWRHCMGQVYAETASLTLRNMREQMRFTTAGRIKEVYSYRLNLALRHNPDIAREYGTVDKLAQALVGNPELLADIVYGGREGTPEMEGHRYIGRGPTQVTHLDNYRAVNAEIRTQPGGAACPDLVEHPEALETPEWGIRSMFADWKILGLGRWANEDDVVNVSSVLNTGAPHRTGIIEGLDERRRGYARAVAIWPLDQVILDTTPLPSEVRPALKPGDTCDEVSDLQKQLGELGWHNGAADGCYDPLTERAVVAVQHEHGLPVTGVADARTRDVLDRTAPLPPARPDLTVRDLEEGGSRTMPVANEVTLWGRVMTWLGFPPAAAGLAESVSPGSISQFVDIGPRVAEVITSPPMLKLLAIGFGVGLLVVGWRVSTGGQSIIGFRLQDAQTGKHLGR